MATAASVVSVDDAPPDVTVRVTVDDVDRDVGGAVKVLEDVEVAALDAEDEAPELVADDSLSTRVKNGTKLPEKMVVEKVAPPGVKASSMHRPMPCGLNVHASKTSIVAVSVSMARNRAYPPDEIR